MITGHRVNFPFVDADRLDDLLGNEGPIVFSNLVVKRGERVVSRIILHTSVVILEFVAPNAIHELGNFSPFCDWVTCCRKYFV